MKLFILVLLSFSFVFIFTHKRTFLTMQQQEIEVICNENDKEITRKDVILPSMAIQSSEEMCVVYMYNESKRCRLFGIEVRGMVVKVKTNDWRVVNIKYVRNSMQVKSGFGMEQVRFLLPITK